MDNARIILIGRDVDQLQDVCSQIVDVTQKTGTKYAGPIPLPTKKMRITTRKAVSGDGTETWDRWDLRIHKRIIDINANERSLRQIMRIQVPDGVHIEIELTK
jgi:small subunit ribosomal protein S10